MILMNYGSIECMEKKKEINNLWEDEWEILSTEWSC